MCPAQIFKESIVYFFNESINGVTVNLNYFCLTYVVLHGCITCAGKLLIILENKSHPNIGVKSYLGRFRHFPDIFVSQNKTNLKRKKSKNPSISSNS